MQIEQIKKDYKKYLRRIAEQFNFGEDGKFPPDVNPDRGVKEIRAVDMVAEDDSTRVYVVVKYIDLSTNKEMVRSICLWSEQGYLMAVQLNVGHTYNVESTRLHNGYWSWTKITKMI